MGTAIHTPGANKEHAPTSTLCTFKGVLFKCASGSSDGWTPITQGYVDLDILYLESQQSFGHPYSIYASSTTGEPFSFQIVAETRSRRTRSTFLQWHIKGGKMNYGVQLATEEQTMKLESVVLKAIGMAKEGVIAEQQRVNRLEHLARTGQTTEAFQLMNDNGAASEAMLMLRINLPDDQSTVMRMLPSTDLGTALRMICDKRNLDPSIHAVQKPAFQGSSLYEQVELPNITVKEIRSNEIVVKCLSTMVGDKSTKVDQVKLLVTHAQHSAAVKMTVQEDLIIQVHLPDGGKTMIKLPANTSMGEMLFHIAEKRDLNVGSIEMASTASGKKKLSVKGTIGQNKIATVYVVNKKQSKGSISGGGGGGGSAGAVSAARAAAHDDGHTLGADTHRLTSLLAEGVPIHDPRVPVGWQLLLAKSGLGEESMRDPKQRQLVIDLVERSGGLQAVLTLENEEIEAKFATVDDFWRQKTVMMNAVPPPTGRVAARSNVVAPPLPARSRRKAPAVPPPPQSTQPPAVEAAAAAAADAAAAPAIPARVVAGPKPTPRSRGSTAAPAPARTTRPTPPLAAPKPMPKPMPRTRPSVANAAAADAAADITAESAPRQPRSVVPGGVNTSMCELDELRGKLASRGGTTTTSAVWTEENGKKEEEDQQLGQDLEGTFVSAQINGGDDEKGMPFPASEGSEGAFIARFPPSAQTGLDYAFLAGNAGDADAQTSSPLLPSPVAPKVPAAAVESRIDSELLSKLAGRSQEAATDIGSEMLSKCADRSTAYNTTEQQQQPDDDDLDGSFVLTPPPPPPPASVGARRFFGASTIKDAPAQAAKTASIIVPPPPSAFGESDASADNASASDAPDATMLPPPPVVFAGDEVLNEKFSSDASDDAATEPSKLAVRCPSSSPAVPLGFGDGATIVDDKSTADADTSPSMAFYPPPPLFDDAACTLDVVTPPLPPPAEFVLEESDAEAAEASDTLIELPLADEPLPPVEVRRGGSLLDLPPPPAELAKGSSFQHLDLDSLPPPPPSSPLPPGPPPPPAPPLAPALVPETLSGTPSKLQRQRSPSLVEALSQGSIRLRKVTTNIRETDFRGRSGSLDTRTALLVSLGSLGNGKSSLRQTPSKIEFEKNSPRRRASSVRESISQVLDSRRIAFAKRDSVVKVEDDDDEWE